MCTPFHDLSLMQHTDLVSVLDRGKTVGDGYRGTGLHQSFQGVLHKSLTLGI